MRRKYKEEPEDDESDDLPEDDEDIDEYEDEGYE